MIPTHGGVSTYPNSTTILVRVLRPFDLPLRGNEGRNRIPNMHRVPLGCWLQPLRGKVVSMKVAQLFQPKQLFQRFEERAALAFAAGFLEGGNRAVQ